MRKKTSSLVIALAVLAGLCIAGRIYYIDSSGRTVSKAGKDARAKTIPVEVAPIEKGPVHLRLSFNGTLEARAEFVVAPKVGGRIQSLNADLADTVKRGQLVAELDSDEAFQAVLQARADLAVAKANQAEAVSALEIAAREFDRIKTLKQRGVASDSQYDAAMASRLGKQSRLEVAKAQVTRAEALLETAGIRLGYTKVTADWPGGDAQRLVAERYVDEGQTVSANTPLLLISELEPITGIVHVTEKDYASLRPGQEVLLTTDAYPEEIFQGKIDRISPVFNQTTRQAKVELVIANPGLKLKPGMFIRATVDVRTIPGVTIVPAMAIVLRQGTTGIFIANDQENTASWRPVTIGITEGKRVQVDGEGIQGRVVVLGQHLLEHGSAIRIHEQPGPEIGPGRTDATR